MDREDRDNWDEWRNEVEAKFKTAEDKTKNAAEEVVDKTKQTFHKAEDDL